MTGGWCALPLGQAPLDIIDGDRGKAYPKLADFADRGHCLFLNATNVTAAGFDFSACLFITGQKDDQLRKGKLTRNDVVLTTRGTLGNTALFSDAVPYEHLRINSGMVIMRTDPSRGVAQPQLPIRDIKKIEVPVPPLKVQQDIVDVFGVYDDLIENNRRRMALLEEAVRQLYREWFVRLRFPGHEHTRITDGVPEGWEWRSLEEFAKVWRGKSYRSEELVEEGGQPFVNLKCIERFGGFRTSGLKRFSGKHKEQHLVEPSEIVMAVTDMTREAMIVAQAGRLPRTVNEPAVFSMDLVKIVPDPKVQPEWVYSLLRFSSFSADVRAHATGTTVLHLKPKYIENWKSLVPPASMRELFASTIKPYHAQQDNLEVQIERLAHARDLLLPRLMSGELAV